MIFTNDFFSSGSSYPDSSLVQLIDSNTFENVNYKQVLSYDDGTPINYFDGILFANRNGIFYKRIYEGEVNAKWFGLKNDGVSDDTTILNNFFYSAKKHKLNNLLLPEGNTYITNTVYMDFYDNSNDSPRVISINFKNKFISVSPQKSLSIGSTFINSQINIKGLSIIRKNYENGIGIQSIGIEIKDLILSKIEINSVSGFDIGILLNSSLGNGGISYNQFELLKVWDNFIGIKFKISNYGYINENIFIGGSFNHSSSFPNYSTANTIHIDLETEYSTQPNSNKFFSQSFEDNGLNNITMRVSGPFNTIYSPRFENVQRIYDYPIIFTSTSRGNQILGRGYGIHRACIVNSGSNNRFEFDEGKYLQSQSDTTSILTLQKKFGSNSKIMSVLSYDSSKNDKQVLSIDGYGNIESDGFAYFEKGFFFQRGLNETQHQRGIYNDVGNPNTIGILGGIGSLYLDMGYNSGKTNLWQKTINSGQQGGWIPIPVPAEPVSDIAIDATSIYSHTQINGIIQELRALKQSLKNADVLK